MKGVFVVLDGVADEPLQVLGQKTPLEAAKTPNLDFLAIKGRMDSCNISKSGVIPQSSGAVVSLFGHDPNFAPRGPLEAMGSGMKITRGDLCFRANFATVDDLETRDVLDRRAGRTLSTRDAQVLARAINKGVKLPFPFEFKPTLHHRGVLVIKGGFSDNITDVDPDYGPNSGHGNKKFSFARSLDEEDDSAMSAEIVNNFLRQSHKILSEHPLNRSRASKGLYAANFILLRGAGSEPVKLKKPRGKWRAFAYTPLEIGVAKSLKMDISSFGYPKMKSIDMYENLEAGLRKAMKLAIKMLRKNRKKYDYFYIHFKETDFPGLDNKPHEKVKMIEMLDKRFFSFLKGFVQKNKCNLVVTSDYISSSRMKSHIGGPVPVLTFPDEKEKKKRFNEEFASKGRKFTGKNLLEKTLFAR